MRSTHVPSCTSSAGRGFLSCELGGASGRAGDHGVHITVPSCEPRGSQEAGEETGGGTGQPRSWGRQSRACHILGFSPCLESSVPQAPWHSLWGISSRRRGQADARKAHHEPLSFGGPGDPSWEDRGLVETRPLQVPPLLHSGSPSFH